MANRTTKQKRRKRPKDSEQYTSAAYRPYVTAIGQIALAWNDLHEILCAFFVSLIAIDDSLTEAAWQSLPSDRAKRGMLRAIFPALNWEQRKRNPRAQEEMKWFLGQLDRLEEDRNNAVHAPLASFSNDIWRIFPDLQPGVQPDHIRANKRATNLRNKDLLNEFRCVRDEIIMFRDYAEKLQWAWRWSDDDKSPWPERPRPPSRGQKIPAKAQPSRQSPAKQLPLLPGSSEE